MSAVAFLGQSPAGPNVQVEPTASDITSPQDDLAAVEQSPAEPNVQIEPTASGITSPQDDLAAVEQSPAGPNVQVEPTASDITSPQDDLAAVEQSPAGQTQLATSCIPGKSFYDLVTIPNRSSRRVTKRKKMTSFNITSEEHLKFIAVKEGKKAKGIGKALAVRPIVEVQQDLLKQKEVAGGKSKTKARSAPKQKSASRRKPKQSAGNSEPCLYCEETYSRDKWIQCQICFQWAHYECAGVDDSVFNFICEICN